jgi:hypothetical protein
MTDPQPSPGQLRAELELLDEDVAAAVIEVAPKTMRTYRRLGIGPRYAVVRRKPKYTLPWLKEWLEAGGTRASNE